MYSVFASRLQTYLLTTPGIVSTGASRCAMYTETDGSLLWRPVLGECNVSIIEDVWSKATNNTWGAISCLRAVADRAAVAEEGPVQLLKVRRQSKAGRNGNGLFQIGYA